MKIEPISRRMLLTGAGVAVALPTLRSLLPRSVRAATSQNSPVRYVQFLNMYGARADQFYGQLGPGQEVEAHVHARPLSDVEGSISPLIGPEFDALRDKFSLIGGLDVIADNENHNLLFPTCASGYDAGLDGDLYPATTRQQSIDVILSESSAVYPSDSPLARRLLVINPGDDLRLSHTSSFSWRKTIGGELEMLRPTKSTVGLFDLLASSFGQKNEEHAASEEALLNAVYDDYRSVRESSRISREDRDRLEAYMSLVQDSTRGADSNCMAPEFEEEVDLASRTKNQLRLVTAAMMCDLTRVVSVGLPVLAAEAHAKHHDMVSWGKESDLDDDFVRAGRSVAQLMSMFDEAPLDDGSLLDQSIVYWSMQYGNALPDDSHRTNNLPVLVGGQAGGQLRSGQYIDYRKDGELSDDIGRGVPLNNLLVTFMNCMGLSSNDYETDAEGFGFYNERFFEGTDRPHPDFWSSTEGKRSPLPYFYQGDERS